MQESERAHSLVPTNNDDEASSNEAQGHWDPDVINIILWKRVTTLKEVSEPDLVPHEIEFKTESRMNKWTKLVQEDLAAKRCSDNFTERAAEEQDEKSSAVKKIEENRLLTQANISNANAKVMRLVKDICAENNEKLGD